MDYKILLFNYKMSILTNIIFHVLPHSNKDILCAFAACYMDIETDKSIDILSLQIFNSLIHVGIITTEKALILFLVNIKKNNSGFSYVLRASSDISLLTNVINNESQYFNDYFIIKDDQILDFYIETIKQNKNAITDNKIYSGICENVNQTTIKNQQFAIDFYNKIEIDDFADWLLTLEQCLESYRTEKKFYGKVITLK